MTNRLTFHDREVLEQAPTPCDYTEFKGYDCLCALTAHSSIPCGGRRP